MNRVGYWSDLEEAIDVTLPYPEHFVDHRWDLGERIRVAHYLRNGVVLVATTLMARCIMGCKILLGFRTTDLTDGNWQWPENFAHYVEVHSVRPPEDFLVHVRNNRYLVPIVPTKVIQ